MCDVNCTAGASLVDALGPEGIFEVRNPGDSPGVALVDFSGYYPQGGGFFGPVRRPQAHVASSVIAGPGLLEQWPTVFELKRRRSRGVRNRAPPLPRAIGDHRHRAQP